jgi:uncharacterized phiE125 gp8 family phage protein
MPLQQLIPPTVEPLSLAEAKLHLRATQATEDSLISLLVAAARARAEIVTRRQIVAARWKLVLDAFPGPTLIGVPAGVTFSLPAHAIVMPIAPLLQVVSIQYLDMAGTLQTMPSSDYTVDVTEPARITPVFGKIWPVTLPQIGAVTVTFDAGHAAPLTANPAADTITVPGWKTLAVNDSLRVSVRDQLVAGDGALAAPLAGYTDYYVQSVAGSNVYKLAATSGGAAIDLTAAGSGDQFIGGIPSGLKSWLLLAVGTLYENRQAVVIGERVNMAALETEFVDGLLDPYRIVMF